MPVDGGLLRRAARHRAANSIAVSAQLARSSRSQRERRSASCVSTKTLPITARERQSYSRASPQQRAVFELIESLGGRSDSRASASAAVVFSVGSEKRSRNAG